jgi:CRISPR-associated endoribonuclease Cas6
MSFVALLLVLRDLDVTLAQRETTKRQTAGTEPHARSVHLVEDAQALQHLQKICTGPAPYQFSLLWDEHRQPSLRITVLTETARLAIPCFLDSLTAQPGLRIGTRRYLVEEVLLSHSPWAGLSSWADFLSPPYGQTVRLHLGTPLMLPNDGSTVSGARYRFPVPCQIFAALARRWQTLGGPPLPLASHDFGARLFDGSIVLADYRLHGCQVLLDESIQLGFRGWISYQSRSSVPAVAVMLTALSRFAFFSGVGAETERGMGAIRVTIG